MIFNKPVIITLKLNMKTKSHDDEVHRILFRAEALIFPGDVDTVSPTAFYLFER